jgi:hypothetical protein
MKSLRALWDRATNWFRKVLPKQSTELSDSPEPVSAADTLSAQIEAIKNEAQDRINKKYPGLRVAVIRNSIPTPNHNWRPNWLELWSHAVPKHFEVRKLREEELRAEKDVEKLVEKALADRREAGIGTEND